MNWFFKIFKKQKIELDPMKYLIVGLGNMGADYDQTRHNIGFEVADFLAKEFDVKFKNDTLGDLAEFRFKGRTFILLKPSTYMNRSGKAVRYWLQKSGVPVENLMVVVDDLQLPFGKMRLRRGGNDGGHNGLKDINEILGSQEYPRLRLGIGSDFQKGRQVDFVLGEWSEDEKKLLPEILKAAAEAIKSFAAIGLERTMNLYNKK